MSSRRRPSAEGLELVLGALNLFGVLARPDRNGEIIDAASFPPTGSAVRTRRDQAAINRGCFDHIDHHALMTKVRRRVGDPKVGRLIVAFLKAGVMSDEQFTRTDFGTPQGGILSPLLANIALSAIEERYERHVWPRRTPTIRTDAAKILKRASDARRKDKSAGHSVCFPIRYADDFIILVSVPHGPEELNRARDAAIQEKEQLATFLRQHLGLELSETKTLVTPVTSAMKFLGHHVRVRRHPSHRRWVSTSVVPKDRSQLLRQRIKRLFGRNTVRATLADRLQRLNPMLRGWSYFYRHAWGAKHVLSCLDHYVWWRILRWLKTKHPETPMKELFARYGTQRKPRLRSKTWRDGTTVLFEASSVRVQQFKLGWLKGPSFAISMESPVHSERCTPGSGRGTRKPLGT